jgi:tyrosinase
MSSRKSRRQFLMTTGMGVAAGLLASPGKMLADGAQATQTTPGYGGAPPPAPLRVRKNVVSSAAAGDLASLRTGVAAMKNLLRTNPNDPRGWMLQAFIHGDCTRFTKCQHGNWFFPPWHRSFIYYFEQLIQGFSNNPGFALPYWDWSRTISVPGSFYGGGNPLDDDISISGTCSGAPTAGRGRTATDRFSQADLDTYVGPTVINRIQQNPDYATYGGGNPGAGELERTPHNFVHRWVGGAKYSNMVQTFSPMDPIFWLHHCNIDRLYSNWLARPGHTPPPESAWKGKSFNDFWDYQGRQVGSQFTCEMTLDSKVMGYIYDQVLDLPADVAALTAPQTARKQKVVGTLAAGRIARQGGVLSFAPEAPAPDDTRRFMTAAAAGSHDYSVRLRIEGVKTPQRQNTGVHVFIGPDITADTPITAPGYVGSFTFFDGHVAGGAGHDHGAGTSILLNASEAFKRLYGDTNLPSGADLSVSLVTRALYTGVDAFSQVEEVQPDKIQFDVVDLDA